MSIMFSALAKKLKQCISNLYEKSLFCSVCQKVSQKYVKNINSSLFVDFFTAYDRSDNSYEKIAGKLNAFFCLLTKPFRFIGKVAMSSLIVNEVKKLLENILFVSLRAFGILALPIGVIGLVSSALDYPGVIVTTLYLFLCMFSAFALLYNKSISCLVNESRLCSLLKIRLPQRECVQYNALLMFFIGLVFGIVSLFTGILPVILAVFLIVAVSVGLYMPLFWTTVLFAFVLPFMPTMVMVAGSLALVLCMFMRNITDHYNFNTKGSVLNIYVALMCVVYVLGVAASVHPASSLKISMVYIAFILSYFVITKALDSLKKLKIFISAMAIASIPVSIYGIYQKLTGFDNENTWLDSEMFENISGRIVSFFDNPNVFGEYIILLFMICIGLMFLSRKGSIKLIYLVIAALLGICMIFTY